MLKLGRLLIFVMAGLGLTSSALCAERQVTSFDVGWRFIRHDVIDGGAVKLDDANWDKVSLPHSFNVADGSNSHTYYRGPTWYRRTFTMAKPGANARTYIEFDGANLATDVWLNGVKIGRHEGGFARFRFDLTSYLKPGSNQLAVRVDNAKLPDDAPLGGDYTVYGGLYRRVRLVTTQNVHLDMMDYGSSGVYFKASDVTAQSAALTYVARVANDSDKAMAVTLQTHLYDAQDKAVQTLNQPVTVAPHTVMPVTLNAPLSQPHLWQGVADPYLYQVEVDILNEGATLDRVRVPVGIRDIRIDADKGLLLNGQVYGIHGVNIHQTMRPESGPAVSDIDMDADYKLLDDMGVTGLRFAHYQHPPHEYDLADRSGYLVWTEVPLVSEVAGTAAFEANASQQLRELILQNYNHPSVFVWGLGNEIYKVDDNSAMILDAMQKLAHKEDASRPTTYANCCSEIDGPQASHTDIIGSNVYFGWYSGEFSDLGPWLDKNHSKRPTTSEAISEYGAGASVLHQEDPPHRPKPASRWHPEQYQTLYHEAVWRQLRDRPHLWAEFIWVGFDFPSAGRDEGDRAGFNDKGLITYDRRVRKDAYFWYQSNWTTKPMVYITSRRFNVRQNAEAEIKVYSNQSAVRLKLNGVDRGAVSVNDHIALWHVKLTTGHNHIEADTGSVRDVVDWIYQPAMP